VTTRRRGISNRGFHDRSRRQRDSRRTIAVVEISDGLSVASGLVEVRLDEPDLGLLSSGEATIALNLPVRAP
jgi:hypothetical protein